MSITMILMNMPSSLSAAISFRVSRIAYKYFYVSDGWLRLEKLIVGSIDKFKGELRGYLDPPYSWSTITVLWLGDILVGQCYLGTDETCL